MHLLPARNHPHLLVVCSTGRAPACGLRLAGWLRRGSLLALAAVLLAAAPAQPEILESRFQRICALTDSAVELSTDELKALVRESEQLLEAIAASDLPQKKVLIFRLKKCRGLFEYLLQTREPTEGQGGSGEESGRALPQGRLAG